MSNPTQDPRALIESLDPEAIQQRLDDLNSEHAALRVLLQAALKHKRGFRCAKAEKRSAQEEPR